ncbi:S8 family serine peptidase [Flavisolibacter nicotianae]|uniref:S8 family serine peptidase n=1 Tax=Flavisolibacter nicotianae TaxID=2364882 RepID=UPI000EAD269A|nr:S8 family serine peptidase [Flavisolibacter nicotianae]
MKHHRLLLFAFFLFATHAFSQAIFLRTGTLRPGPNLTQKSLDSFSKKTSRFTGKAFAVLQFTHLPTAEERKTLAAEGITLLDYLPDNAYTVSVMQSPSLAGLQRAGARALVPLSPQQKMQDYFARGQIPSWAVQVQGTVDVWLSFYPTLDASQVVQQLRAQNAEILSTAHLESRIIALRIASSRLSDIAALPFVEYLQPAPPKDQPLNSNSRMASTANVLNAPAASGGRGLNGEGVTVGHGDNADLQAHADFFGRLINRNASPFNAHGVHTAGIVAGAGNIAELYRGYAPKATLVSQLYSGILDHATDYVRDHHMVITNNSYGNVIECEYNGTYDLTARLLDQQALDLPNLLQVFAAGNSGLNTCLPYPTSYRTVLGGYQSAKNVITVGATNDSGLVADFSSRGPVRDGRLKPEIVAMGKQVISSWPTNAYAYNNGTSMAAPALSGGLALLYQRFRQLNNGADPKNGLMKAILCNGALDRGMAGPDFFYGFGSMNLLRSAEMIEGRNYFTGTSTNATTTTHTITVPAATAELKVLLYWNDLPASLLSTKSLVNDLDLEVVDPSGNVVLPTVLDTTITALGNEPVNGADHVNNMEQVVIRNPLAGTYTLRVKGTTVTNVAQEYFLAYDAVPTGLRITAPAGDMALVPGETTRIAWESHGLSGNVTLAFSPDGGNSWMTIADNLAVSRLLYTWLVPSLATDKALIRLTQNSSGETSTSNPFTILGKPALSLAATQCEGYLAINWPAVPGATDYEVMWLRGDEMKPVGVTTTPTYLFSGLAKDSLYFVTVRARINGKAGRRADAVSRTPNNGTCAGSLSDNDVKMDALVSPRTGRKETSTALGAAEPIRIRIKNLDDAAVSNLVVAYTINGGAPVIETVPTPVAAGSSYVHTFSTPSDLSAPGLYDIKIYVKNNGDAVAANDTLTAFVQQIPNAALDLSTTLFIDSLESVPAAVYEQDTTGIATDGHYDFSHSTPYGRLRTFVDPEFAASGKKAFVLDASRLVTGGNSNYLYGTFNLGHYSAAQNDIRLDFRIRQHGQLNNRANRVWIRGNDTQPWIEVYNLDSANETEGTFQRTRSIEVSNALSANGQDFGTSFQVRWGQWGQWPTTDNELAAGYTLDDIRLYQVRNDVQLVSIDSPAVNNCSLTASGRITVSVRNSSPMPVTNVPVRYSINGAGLVSEIIPFIGPNATQQYTFSKPAGFTSFGIYNVQTFVDMPGDTYRNNDTATLALYNEPLITTFPYLENFESGTGQFYPGGRRSSWEYGTPNSQKIKGAASGANAWKTSLQGTYNDRELSYLYSPCFDISGLPNPTLSFSVALDIEDCGSSTCDAAWVEYSADGKTWLKLGVAGTGTNWFDKGAPRNIWTTENATWWHVATQPLPTGLSRLRLRFVLSADPGVAREGFAVDDIHIYDNSKGIYDGPSLLAPVTQNLSGNHWIDFTSNGQLVASVRPEGQSLGTTILQPYLYTGPVRFANSQYYHNRSFTVKPAIEPTDSVSVRLYFLDAETDSLRNATGCPGCARPESAYALGITQYTDPDKAKENGSLFDNQQGFWNFLPSAQVAKVPFDKGYYAEFKVAAFSEFWLNGGGPDFSSPLPVKLMNLSAVRQGNNVVISWRVGSETDVLRYEIEVARGDDALKAGSFTSLGDVGSLGNTVSTRGYSFTDAETDKFGPRYYRLKIVNADGSYRYSPVKAVVFTDAVLWQAYPNPGNGAFALVFKLATGAVLQARLYDAKGSLMKEYRSAATGFLQKLSIDISANNYASGMYLLRLRTEEGEQVFKLYKQ